MNMIMRNKSITVIAALLLFVLVCTMPGSALADAGMYRVIKGVSIGNGQLEHYDLKVIEDEEVPLSAGTADYSGTVMVLVLVSIVIALFIMYALWFRSHRKRIASLLVMGIGGDADMGGMDNVSILHPIKTVRYERELENMVVAETAKGV